MRCLSPPQGGELGIMSCMKPARLWIYGLVTRLLPETRGFAFKAALLRWCGARVGRHVRIGSSARFLGNGELVIGDDVWIGEGNLIYAVAPASVTIGGHCDFGPRVMVLTGSHRVDVTGPHIAGEGFAADVVVGDGCWLGARSLILPGVVLAEKTLVAAGAVVTRGTGMPGQLVTGVPAAVKKELLAQ